MFCAMNENSRLPYKVRRRSVFVHSALFYNRLIKKRSNSSLKMDFSVFLLCFLLALLFYSFGIGENKVHPVRRKYSILFCRSSSLILKCSARQEMHIYSVAPRFTIFLCSPISLKVRRRSHFRHLSFIVRQLPYFTSFAL